MNFGRNNYAQVSNAYDHRLYNGATMFNPEVELKGSIYDHVYEGSPNNVDDKIDTVLVIDSNDRDHKKYPDPDKYKIKLRKSIKDVTSVELVNAKFPVSSFIINEYNNLLRYQQTENEVLNNTYSEISIPVGNWPIYDTVQTDICDLIKTALEDNDLSSGQCSYSVTVNENTQTFRVSKSVLSSGSDAFRHFNLIFNDGEELKYNDNTIGGKYDETQPKYPDFSIAQLLGFSRSNFITNVPSGSTDAMVHTSDQCYELYTDKYIVLNIRGFERLNSPNDAIDGSFAIIPVNERGSKSKYSKEFNGCDNEEYIKFFNPRLRTLDELDISITDREGRPFLFNGGNHYLQFKISSSTAQSKIK